MNNLLACLGRQQDGGEPPDTPNIDQLKAFIGRFKNQSDADKSLIDRPSATDLCAWTKKVCEYLPNATDANTASGDDLRPMKNHFSSIKQFYDTVQRAGWTEIPPTVQTFMSGIQIYEAISGLACVAFAEHPEFLGFVENQLNEAKDAIARHGSMGLVAMLCCGSGVILARFNEFLRTLDEKLGELGLGRILDFLGQLLDVFCKFFNIDMSNIADFQNIAETVRALIHQIGQQLSSIFGRLALTGDKRSGDDRFAPLEITSKIHRKLSKFGSQAPIVEKVLLSFGRFYEAANKLDDDLVKKHGSKLAKEADTAASNDEPLLASVNLDDVDLTKSDALQVSASNTVREVGALGKMMQNIEFILTYGILALKNEDDVLKPLANHVDDCTNILEKYSQLHPLYKVICGKNYLSKIRVIVNNIIELLKRSKLKLNSPEDFIKEIKERYPELLKLLADDIIKDNIKKHVTDRLPEEITGVVDGAINNIFDRVISRF